MDSRQEFPVRALNNSNAPATPPLWRQVFGLPGPRAGWWAVGFAVSFFVCLGLSLALVAAGQQGGDTLFSNLWLSLTGLTAMGAAIAGGVTSGVAIMAKRERSLPVIMAMLLGLVILTFVLGELIVPH